MLLPDKSLRLWGENEFLRQNSRLMYLWNDFFILISKNNSGIQTQINTPIFIFPIYRTEKKS